jgi:predicted TIM-barrel fold metal-dependent hydrolase
VTDSDFLGSEALHVRDYSIVSADTHLEVSPDVWRPYVDPAFHAFVPEVVALPGGGDAWLMPGSDAPVPVGLNHAAGRGWEHVRPEGVSYRDRPAGSGPPEQRLAEMDQDGVDAEILYPALAGARAVHRHLPPDAQVAIARGYNDWLSQAYCAVDIDRLLGLAILPTSGVDDAIAELRRVRTMPGVRGVTLQQWPNGGSRPRPEDESFWRVAESFQVPLTFHVSFGGTDQADARGMTGPTTARPSQLLSRAGGHTGYVMTQLITERVFDRFEGLRFAIGECGAGWVPFYMEQSDSNYRRHRWWAGIELDHEPSWYVTRHFLFGIQDDRFGVECRARIGVENILWGSDFPHSASDWPESREQIDTVFDGVPEDERRAMVCDNCLEFYGLGRRQEVTNTKLPLQEP